MTSRHWRRSVGIASTFSFYRIKIDAKTNESQRIPSGRSKRQMNDTGEDKVKFSIVDAFILIILNIFSCDKDLLHSLFIMGTVPGVLCLK